VEKKYLKYSAEDFTQDIDFINWVTKGSKQKEWDDFILRNPSQSKNIQLARKIVLALRFPQSNLSENDARDLYENIESYHKQNQRIKRKLHVRKFMQYAALFILALSIGIAIPYYFYTKNRVQFSEVPFSPSSNDDAKLILEGGKEILLKGSQSDLRLNNSGNQIKIDRDSTINIDVQTEQMAELVIPYGRRSNIQLSDGTKVWLNAGSRLIFPRRFSGKSRKVFLKGEAYFDVFKNKNVPFIVTTDKMDITVYGTKFNVNDIDSDNELEVVLVEGAVGLKENNTMDLFRKEIKLSPNQKAVYNKTDNKTNIESNVDVTYYVSWTEGILEFDKESITTVFKRLSRYYNVRFVTDKSVEVNKKISGKLDLKESLDEVMKVVSDAAPITYRIDQNKVIVNSKVNSLPMR
jgi:ferric-dicitrate binding protein FerR (iron transport regulator)